MTTKAKPARKAGARRPARQKAPSAVSPPSHLPPPLTDEQREAAIALLRSWREGDEADEQEQRETMEILRKALNEGRLPGYERFP
jgi:RecB family exonuclease